MKVKKLRKLLSQYPDNLNVYWVIAYDSVEGVGSIKIENVKGKPSVVIQGEDLAATTVEDVKAILNQFPDKHKVYWRVEYEMESGIRKIESGFQAYVTMWHDGCHVQEILTTTDNGRLSLILQ